MVFCDNIGVGRKRPPAFFLYVCGALAQLIRAPALQAGGRGFESLTLHHFLLAPNRRYFRGIMEERNEVMRAQIVKINPKTVVLKNEKGVFATVAKTKLEFEYKIGDIITLEKNGDEVYFLPSTAPSLNSSFDFWDDLEVSDSPKRRQPEIEYNNKSTTSALIAILLVFVGYFIAFYICCFTAIGLIIYSFIHMSETDYKNKPFAITITIIAIILLVCEICVAVGNGL